jgi:hypothetical protein
MDLASLKAALKPLTEFGQEELTFHLPTDSGPVEVTLRALYPREEIACQQYASTILERARESEGLEDDGTLTRSAALSYFDQYRAEVVAYALAGVGGVDFRGVTKIETGEHLPNGTPVSIPKHVALREIINDSWSRGMITIAFSKYGDLVGKIAEQADQVAKDSVADIQSEIERLRERITELEGELESRGKGDHSVTSKQIRGLVEAGKALESDLSAALEESREMRRAQKQAEEEARQILEEASLEEEPLPQEEPPRREPVLPKTAPPPTEKPRSPVEEAASIARAAQRAALSGVEEVEGQPIPTFRMPAETLSPRGKIPEPEKKDIPVNQDPGAGSRNPNFKPPGR